MSALHRYSDLSKDQFGGNSVSLKMLKWFYWNFFTLVYVEWKSIKSAYETNAKITRFRVHIIEQGNKQK